MPFPSTRFRIEVLVFADANARQLIGLHGVSGKCPSTSNFRRPKNTSRDGRWGRLGLYVSHPDVKTESRFSMMVANATAPAKAYQLNVV